MLAGMTDTDPFRWIGATIDGQFRVDGPAGEGTFGVVYRGTHLGFDAPVAIKCLKIPERLGAREREALLASFRDEGKVLYRLSRRTPAIVQPLHIGAADAPSGMWAPYLVMEWLEGETLEEDLAARRHRGHVPRSIDEAIALLAPAAEALAICHEENVSHRDVKPGNIFMARVGDSTTLKVLDFGIAKIFTDTPTLTTALAQTGKGMTVFTPQYGAPEQFSRRFGATGPWTDVFAFALVLVEVICGRHALEGGDFVQLCVSATDEEHRPTPRGCGIPVGDAVEDVLRRALSVAVNERYANMRHMWAALTRAASLGQTVAATSLATLRAPTERGRDDEAGAAVTSENRLCTVAFWDFSGLRRALEERCDPEDASELVDRCLEVVSRSAERLGASIDRPVGDSLMVVFGVPRTSDNDAERAVHMALRAQSALPKLPRPNGADEVELTACVGINSGRVFASSTSATLRASGDAVNVAAELQRMAPEGSIVIGRDTHRQIEGMFRVEPYTPIARSDRSMPTYRVLAPLPAGHLSKTLAFHGIETRFVDRVAERQRVLDAVDMVIGEHTARIVTLVGGAGLGRTRLLAETVAMLMLRSERFLVFRGHCTQLSAEVSYGLVSSLIRDRFSIRLADSHEAICNKLRHGIMWYLGRPGDAGGLLPPVPPADDQRQQVHGAIAGVDIDDFDDIVLTVASLLGSDGSAATLPSAAPDDHGTAAKSRITGAVARLFELVAAHVAIVLLCDDVHLADDASLDLIGELGVRLEGAPLLIVCSARSELFERFPRWPDTLGHQRVDVGRLSKKYIEEMIRDRLSAVADLSQAVIDKLAERADGNPLTLVETLHLLIDAEVIDKTDDGHWVVHTDQLGELALPATVHGVVQARLDRLTPELRRTLMHAAVIGRTFWLGSLEQLRQADADHFIVTPTAKLMAELQKRQLVRKRRPARLANASEWVFAEAATQEVAYGMLTRKVRRALHRQVAPWLEEHAPGPGMAALRAWHYDRGGHVPGAVVEYRRGAKHAVSLGQNADALRQLERARDIHDASASEDWQLRVGLAVEIGDVLRRLGRMDQAEERYNEARGHIGGSASPEESSSAARWNARVDHRLALTHKVRGDMTSARELAERAVERAAACGAVAETASMHALLAFVHRREGRPDESWRAALAGLRALRRAASGDKRSGLAVGELLIGLAAALYARGRFVAAERSYRQAHRAIDASVSPAVAGVALNGVAACQLARGDRGGAHDTFLHSLRLKRRAGDLHQLAVAYNNVANVELQLEQSEAALEHARECVRLALTAGARSDLAGMYHTLVDAAQACGRVEEALEAGAAGLDVALDAGRLYLPELAVALARQCVEASRSSGLVDRASASAARLIAALGDAGEVALLGTCAEMLTGAGIVVERM